MNTGTNGNDVEIARIKARARIALTVIGVIGAVTLALLKAIL